MILPLVLTLRVTPTATRLALAEEFHQ